MCSIFSINLEVSADDQEVDVLNCPPSRFAFGLQGSVYVVERAVTLCCQLRGRRLCWDDARLTQPSTAILKDVMMRVVMKWVQLGDLPTGHARDGGFATMRSRLSYSHSPQS